MVNAECTSNDGGLCDCHQNFFNYGGVCKEVLPAGAPCTAFGQCVANAECSTDTGGTCDCNALFYQHNGTCNPVIPAGRPCLKKGEVFRGGWGWWWGRGGECVSVCV